MYLLGAGNSAMNKRYCCVERTSVWGDQAASKTINKFTFLHYTFCEETEAW